MSSSRPPCPSAPDLQSLAQRVFGHARLRPGQLEAALALCQRRDAVVLLPTGGGKSLCYQLAALWHRQHGGGPTVVVSPLIALMDDQVRALSARGVAAAALHSQQDALVQRAAWAHLRTGKLDLLYVSPERAAMASMVAQLRGAGVSALAIDEAHCMSQWGHDFRPDYLRLVELRRALGVATMALTATATPAVLGELQALLALQDPVQVRGAFLRPNLRFSAHAEKTLEARLARLKDWLAAERWGPEARAIIYTATRKHTVTVAQALQAAGHRVGHYHAGRSDGARRRAQAAYDSGKTPILVATNAFGMGIDHPHVRLVVHLHMPASLEAYYQEAGRAGRDGEIAACRLLYGAADAVLQRRLQAKGGGSAKLWARRQAALTAMEAYARGRGCRQQALAAHFDVTVAAACGQCDTCRAPPEAVAPVAAPVPPAEALETIVAAVGALRRPVGKTVLGQALRGGRAKQLRALGLVALPQHGSLRDHAPETIAAAIEQLLASGRLVPKGRKYPTLWLPHRPVRAPRAATGAPRRPTTPPLQRALERFCRRTARSLGWKPYMVLTRQVMQQLEATRPDSLWALEQLHGMGPAKVARFGADILALVRQHD